MFYREDVIPPFNRITDLGAVVIDQASLKRNPGLSSQEVVEFALSKRRHYSDLKEDLLVYRSNSAWMYREMYLRAIALFAQEAYTHPQWEEDRPPRKDHLKDKIEGHLLVEGVDIIGAASFFERCRLGRHHPRYNEIKHCDDIKVGRMFRMDACGKPRVIFTPLTNEWELHNRGMGASFLPIR